MYKHVQFYILASRIPTEKLHVAWWFQRCIYEAGCRGELLQMRNREVSEGKAGPAVGEMIFPDWAGQSSSCSSSNSSCFCSCKSFKVSRCERNYFFRSGNSLYELLEIPKDSTPEDIKKKYRRLALKYDTIYLELNPVEIPLLQVSPGQKSWQCGGWGDVQEDQQCQCYPEVRLELTMTMKWNLCGLLAKTNLTNVFSDEKKRQLYDEYGSFGLYLADQVGWWLLIDCK